MDSKEYYNLFAIYLRWCIEHDLMGEDFLKEYGEAFMYRFCFLSMVCSVFSACFTPHPPPIFSPHF